MISQMSPRRIYRWPDATAEAEAQLERKADAPLNRARAEGRGAARPSPESPPDGDVASYHPGPEEGVSMYDILAAPSSQQ